MPKLTKQLTLPCINGVDAVKKLRKLMKRGFKDNESGMYTSDYFCENYKLHKETV